METSHIILLVVSASISFAIGRTIMHFRRKKKNVEKAQIAKRAAQAMRDAQPGAESKNKAKRRRQLREMTRNGRPLDK